jgi:hypothetical protein
VARRAAGKLLPSRYPACSPHAHIKEISGDNGTKYIRFPSDRPAHPQASIMRLTVFSFRVEMTFKIKNVLGKIGVLM